jgi:hypothetical protein
VSRIGTTELAVIIAEHLESRDDIAQAEVVGVAGGHAVMLTTQGGKSFRVLVEPANGDGGA